MGAEVGRVDGVLGRFRFSPCVVFGDGGGSMFNV